MASDRLVRSVARGRVVVRRAPNVSGEVAVHFSDSNLPVVQVGSQPIVLTSLTGVTAAAVQRSNLAALVASRVVEIVD